MERARRGTGLKVLIVIVVLILALLGAGLFLYSQGFGWPMQDAVVQQLFKDPTSKEVYASSMTDEDIADMASIIPADSTVTVDGVNKSMSTSTAYVTATTPQGGQVTYEVSLVRDMLGWKVSNVNLYFASQN